MHLAYEKEAAHSWLTRIGRVYAQIAVRLVGISGLVPFEVGSADELRPLSEKSHHERRKIPF